ncbi:MAG TPA: pilus (MSHA type) biogenesis protein MshL [Desulfobulbus sp.]|nr:pilus (MSHA type) biogenesis protein MshL [Desulfobulbus sp.]
MKFNRPLLASCLAILLLLTIAGCGNKKQTRATEEKAAPATLEEQVQARQAQKPVQLPVRYRKPTFIAPDENAESSVAENADEYVLKVGANISSTRGPQPLWDILKRLARLKGMSVSWASDVDQNVLVDVNISADDDFFKAIDNLLRQVDYFHEMQGNTIVVKYKETKKFYISVPYMKGSYTTTVGGNYLTNRDAANGTEGTVKITSDDNAFDVWENIQTNLDTIMEQWATRETTPATETTGSEPSGGTQGDTQATEAIPQATRRIAQGQAYYTIDRSIGLITVTAPRPLLKKIDYYLSNLKKELYRQVMIEAKIIEVYLQDNSKIGLDWSSVLKNFNISGTVTFGGLGGQVYPTQKKSLWPDDTTFKASEDNDVIPFVSTVALAPANFSVMLNALNEQGDAHVLSNPKITVLNGQPAIISVGKDIAYIKTVTKNIDSGTNNSSSITYTAEVDNVVEGIALGVMASIIDDNSVILHLTPVTTDLLDDKIEYRQFGDGLEVGLPRVGIREMSTMVEVNNGEMLIIGGLIDKVEGKQGKFAPIVGDIPLLKYLFGYEEKRMEKRELVILLTPKII